MEKNCRFSYNELDDSLIISCKEENENVKESFMFDNFIFTLTGRSKVVGLQIRNISKVLIENNVSPEILNEMKGVTLITKQRENCLLIGLSIISQHAKVNVPIRVFMQESKAILN